jgi:hypothetical protein
MAALVAAILVCADRTKVVDARVKSWVKSAHDDLNVIVLCSWEKVLHV